MHNPDIKENLHPKARYDIVLNIQDAPGPFESIKGYAFYKVENPSCTPLQPISGARLPPEKEIAITFARDADNIYHGTIHLDALQDEDYFGRGICHWKLQSISTNAKIGEVTFDSFLFLDQIVQQKPFKRYFPKKAYGDDSIPNRSPLGTTALDAIEPRFRSEFFFTTLVAKEQLE